MRPHCVSARRKFKTNQGWSHTHTWTQRASRLSGETGLPTRFACTLPQHMQIFWMNLRLCERTFFQSWLTCVKQRSVNRRPLRPLLHSFFLGGVLLLLEDFMIPRTRMFRMLVSAQERKSLDDFQSYQGRVKEWRGTWACYHGSILHLLFASHHAGSLIVLVVLTHAHTQHARAHTHTHTHNTRTHTSSHACTHTHTQAHARMHAYTRAHAQIKRRGVRILLN